MTRGKVGARPAARRWAIKLDFVGASRDVRPAALERSGTRVSYFKGTPRDWKIGLEARSKIIYRDLWPGIDLVSWRARDRIKYELIVHPGADASKIALAFRGPRRSSSGPAAASPSGPLSEGSRTRRRSLTRRSTAGAGPSPSPTISTRRPSASPWGLTTGTGPLVIDPSSLVYSGFIGGQGADTGAAIALGGDGSVYIVGATESPELSFPATAGPGRELQRRE
ncbi:MAG: hypothetical protein MZV65_00005 [Chromatiales bacterium]|nr:hypothetical protein [Chromatiales bacterium]